MTDIRPPSTQALQSDDYWRLFGMERDPFAGDTLENSYFNGADRQELLQSALHMARFATQAVVFSGVHGIGKTRLLEAVAASLQGVNFVLRLQGNFMLTSTQLFDQIANALGFDSAGLAADELRSQVLQRLQQGVTHSKSLIILIDDAHELLQHTLASLLTLAHEAGNDIKLLLFAAPDANGQLRPELVQTNIQQIIIEPLDLTGVEDYMRFRLKLAGFDRKFPFTSADLLGFFKHSGGVPERTHGLAEEKLRGRAVDPVQAQVQPRTGAFANVPWLNVAAAVGLVILISVLWTDDGNEAEPDQVVDNSSAVTAMGNHKPPEPRIPVTREELPQIDPAPAKTGRERLAITPPAERPVKKEIAARQQMQRRGENSASAVAEKTTEMAGSGNAAASSAVETGSANRQPSVTAAASKPEKPVVKAATPEPAVTSEVKPPVKQEPNSANAASQRVASPMAGLTSDERYLMSLPGSNYTLQLLGSSSAQSIREFANSQSDRKIVIFEQRLGNKQWFAAVTGDYLNREQATTALANLPGSLRDLKPWVRPFNQVQKDIRSAHN